MLLSERIDIDPKILCVIIFNKENKTWVDKTYQISAMYSVLMHGRFTGYNIYFKGSGKKYFYSKDKIRALNFIETISLENIEAIIDEAVVDAISIDKFDDGYYRVYTKTKNYFTNKIQFQSNAYKKIYQYFGELADKGLLISKEDTPLHYLSKNFKRIVANQNSCLFDYLKGQYKKIEKQYDIILPFSFNQSQKIAIENALNNNISVIEGPPGTGKTQTILNLIVNIVANGYTCAVVSNNNTAIENVFDKLNEEKLAFFVASLGNRQRVDTFFSSMDDSEFITSLKSDYKLLSHNIYSRLEELGNILNDVHETENELAKKRIELSELEKEFEHIQAKVSDEYKISQKLKPVDYLNLKIKLESGKPLNVLSRFWISIKFKTKVTKDDNAMLLDAVERLYYVAKIRETEDWIKKDENYLSENRSTELKKEFQNLSREVFNDLLYQRYNNEDIVSFTAENYKYDFMNFLKRYPVVISTSHSLLNNVSRNILLDYLIIDEASQGDLLSSILAINCSKNLVVVGDSKQLQQIEDENLIPCSKELSKKYRIDPCYHYDSNSIIKSVKTAIIDVPTTLLKEHYRCAPDIISFCNKMFYGNELIVMTKNNGIHLNVIKTVPGNHARRNPNGNGQYNEREIDEINSLLNDTPSEDIGVITPFRYQADLIHQKFIKLGIKADTVHKYQGQQKKEIILSFVVNSLEKSEVTIENRLYDFITNKELLNVAISRGINKVTIVVSDKVYHSSNNVIKDLIDYIEYLYGNTVTKESEIISIFDKLYIENRNALITQFQKKSQNYYTELLMSDLISDLLKIFPMISFTLHARVGRLITNLSGLSDEEKRYITHPWTHVDFLFYNNISKKPLFALEVDGVRHHEQNVKQSERDAVKNKAFNQCGIPLHRFKTNESGEEQKLKSILEQYRY